MKILIVNTYDNGGAANSCKRLHLGLLFEGISSNVLLRFKQNNWSNSFCLNQTSKVLSLCDKIENRVRLILKKLRIYYTVDDSFSKEVFLNNRQKGLELFSFPYSKYDITESELYKEATIVNLHWVAGFVDYSSFFQKNTKPVVWTLHDMNPFTGGEHYLEEYLGIDELGHPINRKISKEEINVAQENISIKMMAISKIDNLTIVAPSEWLAEEARKSDVFKGKPVYCIPYGLDSEIFAPRDKNYSRALFNIPKDKKVILFVADSIDNHRKGFIFLQKAFQLIADSNIVLCAIGNKNSDLESLENILELGPIYDERLMSVAYSAADVFILPSLMDNLPNTVLESLMCGTPVIGFPVGGMHDMIQNRVNGFLTEEISVKSLVKTINDFLKNIDYFNKIEIRENALKKYDQKVQSQRYINLFTNILNKK